MHTNISFQGLPYCFALFLFHCTFYSYFSFFTICMPLCCVTLYNLYSYYFALSTERTWFDYISLLIIPCITYYVTNKETLNLEPWLDKHKNLAISNFLWPESLDLFAFNSLILYTCSQWYDQTDRTSSYRNANRALPVSVEITADHFLQDEIFKTSHLLKETDILDVINDNSSSSIGNVLRLWKMHELLINEAFWADLHIHKGGVE